MPKSPQFTDEAYSADIASLQRIFRRIHSDPKRPHQARKELCSHLHQVIETLQREFLVDDSPPKVS